MAKRIKRNSDPLEGHIASIVIDSEYRTALANQDKVNADFESLIDMLECKRNEKDYDWMSDIYIPEMNSIILTDASAWVDQYFPTRDFVEVKLDGESEQAKAKAKAAKKCINNTLNDRDIYYFHKFVRLRSINSLVGHCYALCWWEQDVRKKTDTVQKSMITGIHPETNQPIREMQDHEVETEVILKDHFNFEVIDPRNVFTDTKYAYSAQHKDWITIRAEKSYGELKAREQTNEYINLERVKEAAANAQRTETAAETYNKETNNVDIENTPVRYFDVLDRYGKFWAVVKERDKDENPTEIAPGIDSFGVPLENAELVECIITFAIVNGQKIMIRFIPTPFIDALGSPYKPIVRGWCYIHPTKDEGLSDGKAISELQIAINDTYNMGADRTKLATLPVFKGRKYSLEDNSTVFIEPEHVIELEDPNDLQELVVRDNISGALNQLAMLTGKMQQVTSIYPTTMGALPDKSSTTATAVAGSESRTNARANYKSLTFEYTFLQEFYWIILQMTYRFIKDETAIRMLGEDAMSFDANADYTYTPVSSNIETEYNKNKKVQLYDQTIGRISGLVKVIPELLPVMAHIIGRQLELMGDEFQDVGHMIQKLAKAKVQPEGEKGNDVKDMKAAATSNQEGVEMSPQEQQAREGAMVSPGGGIK